MRKLIILMTALFVFFSVKLYSQPDDATRTQKFITKLNLTDEQKKNVEKVHFDAKKQTIDLRAKVQTAQVELQQIFKADVPDKSAIEKKINGIADLRVQLTMIRINSWFAINKLLTPDQQKIWKEVLEKTPAIKQQMMKKRMGERMGRRMGEGMGRRMGERFQPMWQHK